MTEDKIGEMPPEQNRIIFYLIVIAALVFSIIGIASIVFSEDPVQQVERRPNYSSLEKENIAGDEFVRPSVEQEGYEYEEGFIDRLLGPLF